VKQTQKVGEVPCFSLPLEVEIGTKGGKVVRHEKAMESDSDALVVRLSERPAWVTFDPRLRIVGQVNVEAPADMLRRQLHDAPTARGRVLAAEALEKRSDPATIRALGVALAKKDEAWMVRAEAARVLGKIGGPDAFRVLAGSAETSHPKVRRAVLAALGGYRTESAVTLLVRAAQNDTSYLASAEAARALGETRAERALPTLVELLDTPSWADVIRVGALDGLANLRSEAAVPHVMQRTRYGHSTPTRRAAVLALAHLSGERKVREHLEDLLDDADPHFRMSVIRALEVLGDQRARRALRKRAEREQDGRVTRRIREALRTLAPSTSQDYKKTADEVDRLTREMADLRTRLAKVEQARKARTRTRRAPAAGSRGAR
jgi:aminopeptidase N